MRAVGSGQAGMRTRSACGSSDDPHLWRRRERPVPLSAPVASDYREVETRHTFARRPRAPRRDSARVGESSSRLLKIASPQARREPSGG